MRREAARRRAGRTLPGLPVEARHGGETGRAAEQAPFVPPEVEEVARMFPQLEIIELHWQGRHGRGL